jgi:crossover junction endodeoxyribonuclease RuvC
LQVKSAVTGFGRAEKDQVAFMVGRILKLKDIPKLDDVTDAIAVGICHLNTNHHVC